MPPKKQSTIAAQETRIKQPEEQLAQKKALATNARQIVQLEEQLAGRKPAPRKK